MKITKKQLKRIIKEELEAVMEDFRDYEPPDPCDRALTDKEASDAESLGYVDPHDDGLRKVRGRKTIFEKDRVSSASETRAARL